MTDAERWVRGESRARGATRVMLQYMAERAEGCIAVVSVGQLMDSAKISRRQVFYSLQQAQRLGEIQRIQGLTLQSVSAYHFQKWSAGLFHAGSDSTQKTCLQLAAFRRRYSGSANLAYIRGEQIALLPTPLKSWAPVITDEELRWRSNQLRRPLGLPLLAEEEFRLE